jgi:hypothetical protein
MAFVIIYLPTAERLRLYTFYDQSFDPKLFREQKDIFGSYEEAMNIINDNRILNFAKSKYQDTAIGYIDHKDFANHADLIPKYLLEVIEV